MARIQTVMPRELERNIVFRIEERDSSGKVETVMEIAGRYYPNRITIGQAKVQLSEQEKEELSETEIDQLQTAATFCHFMAWIDLQGPFPHPHTGEILVEDGVDIPLDPRIIQWISTPTLIDWMRQLNEVTIPKQPESRNSRRRLR